MRQRGPPGDHTTPRALRAALPALLLGFLVWVASVALHVLAGLDLAQALSERLALGRVAAIVGAVAAGVVLAGAAQLARARSNNRWIPAALGFFLLWLAEVVLRLWSLALGGPATSELLAARILLANLAMLCLASAMRRILAGPGGGAGRAAASWSFTARAFALQLVAGVLLWFFLRADLIQLSGTLAAALWLGLTAPYAHAYLSLQRTAREVAAAETVAEILTG
jgi:hypothetical protein